MPVLSHCVALDRILGRLRDALGALVRRRPRALVTSPPVARRRPARPLPVAGACLHQLTHRRCRLRTLAIDELGRPRPVAGQADRAVDRAAAGAALPAPGTPHSTAGQTCPQLDRIPSGSSRHNFLVRTWDQARNRRRITALRTRTFSHGAALASVLNRKFLHSKTGAFPGSDRPSWSTQTASDPHCRWRGSR